MDIYGNKVFWAWNNVLNEREIRRQIQGFAQQKIAGFFIHSRCGLKTPYLSEQWFSAVEIAADEAGKQGLEVWLYDEDGWPSGFAGGLVVASDASLCIQRLRLERSLAACRGMRIAACFRRTNNGWESCTPERADCFFAAQSDLHYVDLLNPEACRAFIRCTHEKYRDKLGHLFGTVIKGIFTDEPQMDGYISYSPVLSEKYENAYGRKFEDDLVCVLCGGKKYKKFRLRYIKILFPLFIESYIKQLDEWCRRNHLILTGHLPAEDGLLYQGEIAGSCDLAYRSMRYPGIDFLGRRLCSDVLVKTLGSVKSQEGLERVISETFGCSGWNTNFAQFAWIWGYQAAAGINSACLHFSAYSVVGNRKRDYPAFFSGQEPWFAQWHYLNDWMHAVNEFNSGKEFRDKILVISALENAACEPEENARVVSNAYRLLIEALSDLQTDFETADEFALSGRVRIKGTRLCFGNSEFGLIIVPHVESILGSTAKLLLEYKKNGGRILFTTAPPRFAEYEKSKTLEELISRQNELPFGGVVQNRAELWGKALQFIGYRRNFYCVSDDGRLLKDVRMRVCEKDGETHVFLANKSASDTKEFTLVSDRAGTFRERRFLQGDCAVACSGEDFCETRVLLQPMQSRGFVFGNCARENVPIRFQSEVLHTFSAEWDEENRLALDKCAYSIDGNAFTLPKYVLFVQNEIYEISKTLQANKSLRVRYSVCSKIDQKIRVFLEQGKVQTIEWNGKKYRLDDISFLDRDIRGFDCELRKGMNELTLEYILEPNRTKIDPDKVFESERNRFSYELEIEAVYLCGRFGVYPDSVTSSRGGVLQCEGKFTVDALPQVDFSRELTQQGLFFYSGNFQKSFYFSGDASIAGLSVDCMNAVCAEVAINDRVVGCLFSVHDELDIRKFVIEGQNKVSVMFYSGLRNLLGPHHHVSGEVNFTGQSTFMGNRGFEDEVIDFTLRENTYTEKYFFTPFGGGNVVIHFYK